MSMTAVEEPTTSSPRAPAAKLSRARRKAFRDQLEIERDTVEELYRHDLGVGQEAADEGPEDLVDQANRAYNQDLMLALSDTERETVRLIDDALARFDAGTFGFCENCESPIGLPRLKAVPWARYCIVCQERDENGLLDD